MASLGTNELRVIRMCHWNIISNHHDHIHTHLLSYECRNKYTLCNIYQSGNLTHKLNRKRKKKKNHMSVLYMQCLDILNLIGLPDMVCMLNVCIWVNWIFLGCVCGWPGEHITQDCLNISWYNISITTNFGTCLDSTSVVACARFCHDLVAEISNTMRKWILVKFWFRTPHF